MKLLSALAEELRVVRREDPLRLLRELNGTLFCWFEYAPKHAAADLPIGAANDDRDAFVLIGAAMTESQKIEDAS